MRNRRRRHRHRALRRKPLQSRSNSRGFSRSIEHPLFPPYEQWMHHITRIFGIGLLSIVCISFARAEDAPLKSGIDVSNFDTSVKPGENFYLHVNGNWIKRNPIPPEYSRWGAFPQLRDDNLTALREILD